MEQLVTSDFKLGIIAGGQLGKMLVLAASSWDVKTYILDPDEHCPASSSCTKFIKGSFLDYDSVYQFGKEVDMITFEIENVNIEALKKLKAEGKKIFPDPETIEIIKDKGLQKQFYLKHNLPCPSFQFYNSKQDIVKAVDLKQIKFPFVQKARTAGYDGKGVAIIRSETDFNKLLDVPSIVEDKIELKKEISVIVARNERGEIKAFSPVEMEFNDNANLVERLICPSDLDTKILGNAIQLATNTIAAFQLIGILAVELFLDMNDRLWINEVAPRPHNSGHHTIESAITSQYEQHLRAIFNFPLGSTKIKLPSVMINLLGEEGYDGPVKYEGLTDSLAIEGVKIHLYGKRKTKAYRKMGHVTIISDTISDAKKKAEKVKQILKIKSW